MADEPELDLEADPDAELSIEGDALSELTSEEAPELPTEAEASLENALESAEPDALMENMEAPENGPEQETPSELLDTATVEEMAVPEMPLKEVSGGLESAGPEIQGSTPLTPTETSALPSTPTAPEPATGADGAPGVMDALKQVLGAFERLIDVLPGWAGMVIAASVAALLGLLIGWRISRRGMSKTSDNENQDPVPTVRAALPAPENPAFKNYQVFLETKGVSAKERDAQMRAFSERYREMRQNLRDLIPGNKELDEQVELVRDALDAGDFDRVFALLTRIGNKENTDGMEKRAAALKHLMAAAIAKSVAGDLQMSRLEYESAAENFRQAVEALPPFQEDLHAEFLNKYGTASYQAGQNETAVAAFERALQILEKRLGKNHPDVATALNNLALLHYSRGNYDAAEPLYKRSLTIDEQTLGIDHTGVATDLNNLALLYKKKGNLEEAEPLLRRAMEIKEKNFDPGHPSLVTGLRNYASLLRSLGREEEADIYERRATVLPPSRTGIAAE